MTNVVMAGSLETEAGRALLCLGKNPGWSEAPPAPATNHVLTEWGDLGRSWPDYSGGQTEVQMMAGDDIFIVIIVSTVSKYPTMARSVPGNVESLLTPHSLFYSHIGLLQQMSEREIMTNPACLPCPDLTLVFS